MTPRAWSLTMNAVAQPSTAQNLNASLPALTAQSRVAARRETLTALAFGPPAVDLTIYADVLRRSHAGGHWSATSRWIGFVGHTIGSYAVTLYFDSLDRPSHFVISGAREVRTDDASPESLARGLNAAVRGGPLLTWAPNFVPGISL